MELGDDFANCCCLACAWRTGDVYAAAAAGRDGGFKVAVDCGEFVLAAGKGGGDRGDMEVITGQLVWRAVCVRRGEEARGQGGYGEGFFDDDPFMGGGRGFSSRAFGLRGWGKGLRVFSLFARGSKFDVIGLIRVLCMLAYLS